MKWHVEIVRERFAEIAMQIEWTAMAQHARLRARPSLSIAKLSAAKSVALCVVGLVAMAGLWEAKPQLRFVAQVGATAFLMVLVLWVIALVLRRRSPKTVAAAQRRMVARRLVRIERQLPIALDYDLHDGVLDLAGKPRRELTAHTAIATPGLVALFRRRVSPLPWRIIHRPPAELLAALRERGTDVVEIDGPPASYIDPLPAARQV